MYSWYGGRKEGEQMNHLLSLLPPREEGEGALRNQGAQAWGYMCMFVEVGDEGGGRV